MRWLLMVVVVLAPGCGLIEPATTFKINPITRTVTFTNNKDVDLSFDEITAKWDKEGGGEIILKNWVVSDKATPVIEANVAQMMAFVEQQKAANEGIIGSLRAIGDTVSVLSRTVEAILRGSSISLDTPYGAGSATLGTPATQPG